MLIAALVVAGITSYQQLGVARYPSIDMPSLYIFATYLEKELSQAAAAEPRPARPLIHRLNRAEYSNAIRDLLTVEFDAESFLPADDSSEGFDNLATVLSVSPLLMERYLLAAKKISRLAIGNISARPTIEIYRTASKNLGPEAFQAQDTRLSDDLPVGSRGGIAIRHHFPLDGEYVLTIRLIFFAASRYLCHLPGEGA